MKTEEEQMEIDLCVKWIRSVPKIIKTFNMNVTSYGYKHEVENYFNTYISNGSFKEAARICGLKIKVSNSGSQNEFYNIFVNQ
jgi:hypothetical protein